MRGPPSEMLQTIPTCQHHNYNLIVQAPELRYGDPYRKKVYQTQIKSGTQKPRETLQEFETNKTSYIFSVS